jgi:hypothetical protein
VAEPDHATLAERLLEQHCGSVRRRVVDGDNAKSRMRLCGERLKTLAQPATGVASDQDDEDARISGRVG